VNDLAIVQEIDTGSGLPTGNLTLSWGAVTSDIEGILSVVDHYDLYGSDQPFGRADLSPALLVAPGVSSLSVTVVAPAGRFNYFLVAVDRRGNVSTF